MTEQSQTDVSGIARTPTGEINNPTAQPAAATTTPPPTTEASPATTTPSEPTPPKEPRSLLNDEGEPPKEPVKPAEGAPEKYEDYKLPEGFTLDEGIKTKVDDLFKGAGLSQEQAQKFIDFYTSETKEAFNAPFKAFKELTERWRSEANSHPDLKGKLGQGQEVNVRIGKFLQGINDPQLVSDFQELMDLTGAGNHQAFIRVIDYAARKLTEGGFVAGRGPSAEGQRPAPNRPPPTAAEAMWPNLANRQPQ